MSISSLEIQALGQQNIFQVAADIALTRYVTAIALTILCYDTFLTLGSEIHFLWPKRWSAIKILTYLNRTIAIPYIIINAYVLCGLTRHFSDKFCEILLISSGYAAYVSFAICNWILLARTKALLGNKRAVSYILIIFYFLSYGVNGVLVTLSSAPLVGKIFWSTSMKTCGIAVRPSTMGFVWIPPMVFETTTFVLTIFKLYQKAAEAHGTGSNLLAVLYRDGVFYYFIIIGLRIFNLYAWIALPLSLIFIGIFLLWSVMTISVTRLQINLIQAVDPLQTITFSLPVVGRMTGLTSQGPRYRMSHIRSKRTQPSQVQMSVEIHITSDVNGHFSGDRSIHVEDHSNVSNVSNHSNHSDHSAHFDDKSGKETISMRSMGSHPNPPINPTRPRSLRYDDGKV